MTTSKGVRAPRGSSGSLVGMFALLLMESGPITGGQLTARIAERTFGKWSPGAGTIYPALQRMVERDWARLRVVNGKKLYSITPSGKRALRVFSAMIEENNRTPFPGWRLYRDFLPSRGVGDYIVGQLRFVLNMVEEELDSSGDVHSDEDKESLEHRVRLEVDRALARAKNRPGTGVTSS